LNSKHSGVPEDSKSPTLELLGFTPTLGQSGVATYYIIMTIISLTMTIDGFPIFCCDSQVFPSAYLTLLNTWQGPPMLDHDNSSFP
jgi:hypothetical protein